MTELDRRAAIGILGLGMAAVAASGSSRIFGIDPRTVAKMLAYSVPPGYRRHKAAFRPKLDGFTGIIDQILEADKLVHKKQTRPAH